MNINEKKTQKLIIIIIIIMTALLVKRPMINKVHRINNILINTLAKRSQKVKVWFKNITECASIHC